MEKGQLNALIGQRLKHIRVTKGLSLDRVAELTGVSKPMLGQIERAQSNPTVSTLWKIAEGLR
ncbi:MAG TPA: helix-turn-helix transcriptional regulator, partial [Candidatus Angelobacter sp.]|nr:helix-turn-helix transcriptional regulator [Candidatus Angelobacter sp.]